jgi:hypothetical protein
MDLPRVVNSSRMRMARVPGSTRLCRSSSRPTPGKIPEVSGLLARLEYRHDNSNVRSSQTTTSSTHHLRSTVVSWPGHPQCQGDLRSVGKPHRLLGRGLCRSGTSGGPGEPAPPLGCCWRQFSRGIPSGRTVGRLAVTALLGGATETCGQFLGEPSPKARELICEC